MTVALTVVAGMVMIPIDITIVAVAIAQLSQDTGASLSAIQWVSTGYALALTAAIPAAAWAMGRVGTRRLYLASIAVFVVASAAVALSWNVESMIAFRVLQGLAGGLVAPTGMALVLTSAAPEERGRALAVFGLSALVAPVMGPVLGGWLLDTWSWRWMFWINVPLGLLGIALGLRNLPHPITPVPVRRLDVRGLLLLAPALTLIVLATARTEGAVAAPEVLLPLGVGFVLLALFGWHASRAKAPLLDIGLLGRRATGGGAMVLFLFTGGLLAQAILIPLYWQVARGESATTTGLLMAPAGLAAAASMQVAGRLIDKLPAIQVILSGILLAISGSIALMLSLGTSTPFWHVVVGWIAVNVGAGFAMMPTMTVATRRLRPADIPSGSTLLQVTSQASGATFVAMVTVLLGSQLSQRLPNMTHRGVGTLAAMSPETLREYAPAIAEAFQVAFWLPIALMVAAALTAVAAFRTGPGEQAARPTEAPLTSTTTDGSPVR